MKSSCLKSCFVLFFILLTSVYTSAQKGELSQARISFSETMWNFGYVPKTGKVIHTYQIKNIGQDTLVIVKVRTSCGCASAPLSKQRIAPDETAKMKVIFDPRKIRVGETIKRLHVISNDPNNPFADVQFTAKIGKRNSLVKLTPTEINFDTIAQGIEDVRTVTVENISGEELFMELIEGPGDNVELDFESRILKPGESTKINLKLKKGATSGNLQTSLTLDFEGSRIARVSIPIGGVVVSK
ncbi:MAG: hypothetical protein AMJ91_01525 [candidate division Zixibacteria bacterium SM23_73_3]|nr:MAG: hypothetical protein AMJ91_01525 [candidate division Zixibacteria bacterium SM23_73_3]